MLPRTKYNRFRNDSVTSVDDLLHNLSVSGGGKVSAARAAPAAAPYLVSGEALRRAPDDGPGSLGHLLHKVSHLKLSSSGLRGLSAARERAGARLSGSCSAPSLAAPDGSAPPGPRAPAMRAARKGRPGDEPPPRAPHANDQVLGAGVTYVVKYLGCIEVLRSMRSLDFSTRTQITSRPGSLGNAHLSSHFWLPTFSQCSQKKKKAKKISHPQGGVQPVRSCGERRWTQRKKGREAISRVCEAVPGSKGAFRKRKPPSKMLSSILGKSNLQFAGMSISLTISTASLNLRTPDSKQIIANHHMQSISFASGGDPDTTDYVAYVAKDPVNRRACHILECCDGLAQDVIGSIGQAFELRFKQYLQCPSKIAALHDRMQSLDEPWTEEESDGSDHPYYNSIPSKTPPPGGFADARLKARPHGPDTAQFAGKEQTYYQGRHLGDPFGEDWQQTPVRQGERQGSLDIYSMPEGKSHVAPTGEAPTYVNTQRIPQQTGPATGSSAESSPRKDLFDMKPFEDALKIQSLGPVLSKAASMECISPVSPRAPDAKMLEELKAEPWYQGEMSRKEAEGLLKRDGDFLVRKSTTNPGSFVLTGMHNGQAKHLLLVDPEGTIRTKDRIFDSISHLINHHLENSLPIVSAGSELCLQQPVERNP
ncbi:SHC-transforming protein 3 isoform X1 [Bos javanicus]|uniref:SHC-transforming protein 3 isoform X1 n=1 Tax=Bos taurus TaxID=9913 RepID=UPI0028CB450D|nr:SHC-transforming protein 3 isoform X1 [Bos taurus]XP_059745495.1 SHC-transforming protein 3 isoform X1 [Bos taurus]XP_061282300.1 SHC-transforming protein 3 isoform X1 [Bos javanicus]